MTAMPVEEIEILDEAAESEAIDEGDVLPLYQIASYGADFDVSGIVGRLDHGDIQIPLFQRGFVWTRRQAARFVESLLMGLPVPGIFLWRDPSDQTLHVIDGGQRLRTLQAFYKGVLLEREFKLPVRTSPYQKVHPRFQNQTYSSLDDEDRRRLDNSIIHATILHQERPPTNDSSIYYIFERLNTEGTPLQPQEIRSAVYRGPLNDLLIELNSDETWRSIYGRESPRLKDRELILRFFALFFVNLDMPATDETAGALVREYPYSRPMKEFLNSYSARNKDLRFEAGKTLRDLFLGTISTIGEAIGHRAFRRANALNAAIFDAVMVGLARRLGSGSIASRDELKHAYDALLENPDFINASSRATADPESVKSRIGLATEAFARVR